MKAWQAQVGFWGTILWLCTFEASKYANNHGWDNVGRCISGYMIGFATAYCGVLLKEILCGRWKRVFDEHILLNIASIIPLASLSLIGIAGFLNGIFGNTQWQYNIAFFVSGLVVSQGLVPFVSYVDNCNYNCINA